MNDLTLLQKQRSEHQLGLMLYSKQITTDDAKEAAKIQGLRFFMINYFANINKGGLS